MPGWREGWREGWRGSHSRVVEHFDHPLNAAVVLFVHRENFVTQGIDVLVYLLVHGNHLVTNLIQGLVDLIDCIVHFASVDDRRCSFVRERGFDLRGFVMLANCVRRCAGRNRHAPVGCRLEQWDRPCWRLLADWGARLAGCRTALLVRKVLMIRGWMACLTKLCIVLMVGWRKVLVTRCWKA